MTFFKPLRRKIGVVTLLLACVFAVGWTRSLREPFQIKVPRGKHEFHFLASAAGQLTWERCADVPDVLAPWLPSPATFSDTLPVRHFRFLDHGDVKNVWRFAAVGFDFGQGQLSFRQQKVNALVRIDSFVIPYWSIVIPPTLVSAWLLLSQPRLKKRHDKQAEKI